MTSGVKLPRNPRERLNDILEAIQQVERYATGVPEADDLNKYSPLWHVSVVLFNPGVQPRALHSEAEILAAETVGDVTVIPDVDGIAEKYPDFVVGAVVAKAKRS